MFKFLGNLFRGAGRIVLTVLLFLAGGIACVFILEPIFIKSALSSTSALASGEMGALLFSFVFCIIVEIAWDVLDMKILDNIVGRIIKRILFFLAFAIVAILCIPYYYTIVVDADFFDLGFIGKGLIAAVGFVPATVAGFYTYAIVSDMDKSQAPFIPLYCWGGSVVLGLLVGILAETAFIVSALPIIALGASIGFMVFYMIKTKTFIFSDPPYQSSGYGGSSYGGSSYGGSSYDDEDEDTRGSDGIFLNELKSDFYTIASNNSTSHSLGYGATVMFDVDMTTYGDSVVFRVNGTLCNATFNSVFERDTAQSHLEKELKRCMEKVFNEAQAAVRRAQSKYKDYDNYGSISVEPGTIN